MYGDEFYAAVLTMPRCAQTQPFGPDVLVFKVGEKMFATLSERDGVAQANLKCDPQRAVELRDEHASIVPGYHMNKRHWNTVLLDGSLPSDLVEQLIAHSYQLVVASLTCKQRAQIES